jgi:hypothetical protein
MAVCAAFHIPTAICPAECAMDLSFPAVVRIGKNDLNKINNLSIQCKAEKIQNK